MDADSFKNENYLKNTKISTPYLPAGCIDKVDNLQLAIGMHNKYCLSCLLENKTLYHCYN